MCLCKLLHTVYMQVPSEARGYWISWSYRWQWNALLWALGTKPGALQERSALLIDKASCHPYSHISETIDQKKEPKMLPSATKQQQQKPFSASPPVDDAEFGTGVKPGAPPWRPGNTLASSLLQSRSRSPISGTDFQELSKTSSILLLEVGADRRFLCTTDIAWRLGASAKEVFSQLR